MKRFLVFGVVYSVLLAHNAHSFSFIKDPVQSFFDEEAELAKKVPVILIPTPDQFFQSSKNTIAGFPFELAFKIVNTTCSASLPANGVRPKYTPEIGSMNFVLKADLQDYLIPLTSPELLWTHEKFNPNWPLALLVTGWTIGSTNSALDQVYEAYHCRGRINFVSVDAGAYFDTLYNWSAFNTEAIGEKIAIALEILTRNYPIANVHLIGHGLGAHISGSAGRSYSSKTNNTVPRITGLDPANPCFNEDEALLGLSRGDADFIDVIHSNPGALGKWDSIGDVDFYPNGLNGNSQPGCLTISCSHGRAWEFYAETVYPGNEENFMGTKCASDTAVDSALCPESLHPMGFAVPKNLTGNLFLETNSRRPYGRNHRGPNTFRCNVIQ